MRVSAVESYVELVLYDPVVLFHPLNFFENILLTMTFLLSHLFPLFTLLNTTTTTITILRMCWLRHYILRGIEYGIHVGDCLLGNPSMGVCIDPL